MSSRARAIGFAIAAVCCAVASAGVAADYSDSVEQQLGELRMVVVVVDPLDAGTTIDRGIVRRALERREVPVRFAPPDAIVEPDATIGRKTAVSVPAGSYLTVSQLKDGNPSRPARLGADAGLQPIEIGVTSAGALASMASNPGGLRVDVVVATQPDGVNGQVEVVAGNVRLVGLDERPTEAISGVTADWTATLAVDRETALRLIEAENFAGEIRLIPRG